MKKPVIFIILTAILAFSCKDTERAYTSDRNDIERRDAVKSIIMVSLPLPKMGDQFFNNYSWDVVWHGNIINILSAMNENIVDYPELSKYRSQGVLTLAVVNGNNDLSVPLNNFSKSEVI